MTEEEIELAAERLAKWDARFPPSQIYGVGVDPIHAADDDAWDLAREFRKRLAAEKQQASEDAEPIDDQVINLGMLGVDDKYFTRLRIETDEAWLYQDPGESERTIDLVVIARPQNKGQLRRLLESLKGGGK